MYSMKNAAITTPSATVRYSLRIFAGSTWRTIRELSIRLTVWNSVIAGVFFFRAILIPCRPLCGRRSFRTPQLRASRTRVAHHLLLTGLDHVFRQHAERSCSLTLLKRMLHQAVFPRVVTQYHPAASRIHCGGGPRKKLPEFLHLSIHRYPQRQKRFCCGMQSLPSPLLSGPCHSRCQVRGISDGPRSHDRPGDPSGIVLIGFPIEQVGNFLL